MKLTDDEDFQDWAVSVALAVDVFAVWDASIERCFSVDFFLFRGWFVRWGPFREIRAVSRRLRAVAAE